MPVAHDGDVARSRERRRWKRPCSGAGSTIYLVPYMNIGIAWRVQSVTSAPGLSSASGNLPLYFASAVILRVALGMVARPAVATLYGRTGSPALSKPRQVAIGKDPRRNVIHNIG